MGRSLRYLGVLLLAATVWLLIAGSAGWVSADLANRLFRTIAGAGVACVAGGVVLGLLGKLGWHKKRGKCIRCGAPTDSQNKFCLDHLLQATRDYRDQAHDSALDTRRPMP